MNRNHSISLNFTLKQNKISYIQMTRGTKRKLGKNGRQKGEPGWSKWSTPAIETRLQMRSLISSTNLSFSHFFPVERTDWILLNTPPPGDDLTVVMEEISAGDSEEFSLPNLHLLHIHTKKANVITEGIEGNRILGNFRRWILLGCSNWIFLPLLFLLHSTVFFPELLTLCPS